MITSRILGSGMYSKVYLADDLVEKRQLACKIVNLKDAMCTSGRTIEEIAVQQRERRRLIREVKLLAKMDHV